MLKNTVVILLTILLCALCHLALAQDGRSFVHPQPAVAGSPLNALGYRYTLKQFANDPQIQSYWLCRGFTKWSDGTETQNFERRAPYYSRKEGKKAHKKALTSCDDWFLTKED